MTQKAKILAVDDEEFNLDIMTHYLSRAGFDVISAGDGLAALKVLEGNPDVDLIVLDRMMPHMDGMEFLKVVKVDKRYCDIPVVMQTAAALTSQVLEGIDAGVHYYLTKPYEHTMLFGIVNRALRDNRSKKALQEEIRNHRQIMGLMEGSRFRFKSVQDAKNLAFFIAHCFPEPEKVVFGLNELLVNAVEHGNLGITYEEKSLLLSSASLEQEIERRLASPEYGGKSGSLTFSASREALTVRIQDAGEGFDWHKYLELSPDRATDLHGRGIATARKFSFDEVEYMGVGNEVLCTVYVG